MDANARTYQSIASSNSQTAFMAFVDNTSSWVSAPLYDNNGAYAGTSGVGGARGEWVQLSLPAPVLPLTFHIVGNANSVAVYGSVNGTIWEQVKISKFINGSLVMGTNQTYSNFRIVVLSVTPGEHAASLEVLLSGFVKNQVHQGQVSKGTAIAILGVSVGCTVIAAASLFIWAARSRRRVFFHHKPAKRRAGSLII